MRADLEEIRVAARRATDLTRQLLAFARRQVVAPKVLDLNGAVSTSLAMLRRLIGEDIELCWTRSAEAGRVRIDPSQVDQILTNLVANARDAIDGVGRVTVRTRRVVLGAADFRRHEDLVSGPYAVLEVSDTGRGMDSETAAHLFEPFFTTKPVGQGTGLGLATVYGIVKQNDGCIEVDSERRSGHDGADLPAQRRGGRDGSDDGDGGRATATPGTRRCCSSKTSPPCYDSARSCSSASVTRC